MTVCTMDLHAAVESVAAAAQATAIDLPAEVIRYNACAQYNWLA